MTVRHAKPRTRTDVGNVASVGNRGLDDGAIENVPAPQAGNLTRTNQAAFGSGGRKMLHVPLGEAKPVTENLLCRLQFGCRDVNHDPLVV